MRVYVIRWTKETQQVVPRPTAQPRQMGRRVQLDRTVLRSAVHGHLLLPGGYGEL